MIDHDKHLTDILKRSLKITKDAFEVEKEELPEVALKVAKMLCEMEEHTNERMSKMMGRKEK